MCGTPPVYQTPDRQLTDKISVGNPIGDLFGEYGEQYINIYKPSLQQIKLIRAIRVCKTPTLGGTIIRCKDCGHKHYIYHSCGHSHCMICQSIKREQWIDKLRNQLLKVPYVHTVFTLPHQLNGLARSNENVIYSLIMRVAWMTIKALGNKQGFTAGMTSILHTFGSDMKYHIHVHALVTFGGLNQDSAWIYPKDKHKLDKYRSICSSYKTIFIKELRQLYKKGTITYHHDFEGLISDVEKIRWVVHTTRPSMDTKVIEDYLAKYINRIAVSNKRLDYIKDSQKVILLHNDYKNQQAGQVAPKAYKIMEPLVAIDQILQHVLPPYFQKSRRYGIHNSSSRLKESIPNAVKRNSQTIRTVFEIITELMKHNPYKCERCHSDNHQTEDIKPDKTWILTHINSPIPRPPPAIKVLEKSKPI